MKRRVDQVPSQHVYGQGDVGINKMASANINGPAEQPLNPRIYDVPYGTEDLYNFFEIFVYKFLYGSCL